jgi:hypothetical protein
MISLQPDRKMLHLVVLETRQMAIISNINRFAGPSIPALIVIFMGAFLSLAQTKQILTWQQDLAYLQNASGDKY